jgi:tRNA threonylcarbamoyladenosine biosynthesis protein TsaB
MVRILAIETTEAIASIAAYDDDKLLLHNRLDSSGRSAQLLAPGLKTALAEAAWRTNDIDLVAVAVGPGPFTGLRVGVVTAKTLAYAAKADILGVDTLEAIAAAAPNEVELVSAAVDAQRGDVVAALFQRDANGWFQPSQPAELISADAWLKSVPAGACVSGPVLRKLARQAPPGVQVVDPAYWLPTAAAVGRLAARDYAAGRRDDLWTLVPRYSRRSAAEEKRGHLPA